LISWEINYSRIQTLAVSNNTGEGGIDSPLFIFSATPRQHYPLDLISAGRGFNHVSPVFMTGHLAAPTTQGGRAMKPLSAGLAAIRFDLGAESAALDGRAAVVPRAIPGVPSPPTKTLLWPGNAQRPNCQGGAKTAIAARRITPPPRGTREDARTGEGARHEIRRGRRRVNGRVPTGL
jgi:hypothetical protein